MSDETAILQMIRVLPMVEALHTEAKIAASGGGGLDAAEYCVRRMNTYAQKATDLTGDDLLEGLKLSFEEGTPNEQKVQQVVMASSELQAYLRQQIGINIPQASRGMGPIYNAPSYQGCTFPGGVPKEEREE